MWLWLHNSRSLGAQQAWVLLCLAALAASPGVLGADDVTSNVTSMAPPASVVFKWPPFPEFIDNDDYMRDYTSDLILLHGFLVFFMQVGFISIEVGYGRAKNVRNVLLKNIASMLLSVLCWWSVGYAFAHGQTAGGVIGSSQFFRESSDTTNSPWFFSWTFALATVTIVSGCLAERTNLMVYPIYTVLMVAWVHPVFAHWVWDQQSWLYSVSNCDFLDFAGGTVVHMLGGTMGLVGAFLCGPRLGRFEDGEAKEMPGHSATSVSIGTLFLWFGWFGFNCGSTYLYHNPAPHSQIVDRVAMNMVVTGSCSGLAAMLLAYLHKGNFDLTICCNGLLTGLVAATPSCAYVASWSAAIIGLLAGLLYMGASSLLLRLHIDDPLDSSAIHCCGGAVGTLLVGVFAQPRYVEQLVPNNCGGFIFSHQGGAQLGMQILGLVLAVAWCSAFSWVCFYMLHHFGRLRVDQTTELAGIDNIEHGGPAYPEFNLVTITRHHEA